MVARVDSPRNARNKHRNAAGTDKAKSPGAADRFALPHLNALSITPVTVSMIHAARAMMRTSAAVGVVIASLVVANQARGQAGPPLITNDPGTPGDRKWEINLAFTLEQTRGARAV